MPLKLRQRHGGRIWYIVGTLRRVTVDESTGLADRAKAEEVRSQREWQIIQESIHGRKATATFLEAAVSYLEHGGRDKTGGERTYIKPLLDHFGTTPLTKIDQVAIDKAAKKLCPDVSSSTLNRQVFTPISAVLRHAAKRGMCELLLLDRPRPQEGRVRWLTLVEATRLAASCAEHLRPLVIFLLYTGARMSEALYLDWHEVNLDQKTVVFINNTTQRTKNQQNRCVPLPPSAVAALANLGHREGAVFRRPDGKPYERKKKKGGGQIKTAFMGACRRARLTDFHPHDCRHTWATWHYAKYKDLQKLKDQGGWKTLSMVMRYAHSNGDPAALDALIQGISRETATIKTKNNAASNG